MVLFRQRLLGYLSHRSPRRNRFCIIKKNTVGNVRRPRSGVRSDLLHVDGDVPLDDCGAGVGGGLVLLRQPPGGLRPPGPGGREGAEGGQAEGEQPGRGGSLLEPADGLRLWTGAPFCTVEKSTKNVLKGPLIGPKNRLEDGKSIGLSGPLWRRLSETHFSIT